MSEQRKYDEEYKKEAVKLANKIGSGKAADELGIPKGMQGIPITDTKHSLRNH